jgi:hypothetical protein
MDRYVLVQGVPPDNANILTVIILIAAEIAVALANIFVDLYAGVD